MKNRDFIKGMTLWALTLLVFPLHAFHWHDLFATQDQQAMRLMNNGHYEEAKQTFQRHDWQAASAYRAGDYPAAAKLYPSLKNENAFYNEGNALAHLGQYEKAIQAYDRALAMNPHLQDAVYNRKIIEELLKKQKEKQQNQPQQEKDQQQNQDQQHNQDKQQTQDKQQQAPQQQDKSQQNNNQTGQDQSDQNQRNKDESEKAQDKQNQHQPGQGSQDQEKAQPKQNEPSQQDPSTSNASSAKEKLENQQAREQLMQIIPDDPGGLLREKFYRDYLRRQQGYGQ